MLPHKIEVNEPHDPEKACTLAPEVDRFPPIELRVTVAVVAGAVNLYQTSSSAVPVAQPAVTPVLSVAPQTVPALFVVPIVNDVADEHSSFDGGEGGGAGCVTQISKDSVPEGTLYGLLITLEILK